MILHIDNAPDVLNYVLMLLKKDIRQFVTKQFSEYRHGWAPAYIQ
ncbi:hypothetical protein PPM_3479 [Paenibacillus polymyxa M1]|nr:hypothetical protein PPM_3479 [Paenibacillus polymyxa M1]